MSTHDVQPTDVTSMDYLGIAVKSLMSQQCIFFIVVVVVSKWQ